MQRFLALSLLSLDLGACATTAPPAPPAVPSVPAAPAAAVANDGPELTADLLGLLWMQHAPEWDMLCEQAYDLAHIRLHEAIFDTSWTAALEQRPGYQSLPPAIILDIDETVLSNAAFTEGQIETGQGFSPELWKRWEQSRSAPAIPGVVRFIDHATDHGVAIYYVTNRAADAEADTIANLRAEGLPVAADGSNLWLKGEQPDWVSDKTSRRAELAEKFRIILLIGDDFNDFTTGVKNVSIEERYAVMERNRSRIGRQWIVLPNPLYGSFAGSLVGFERLGPEEDLQRRLDLIDADWID